MISVSIKSTTNCLINLSVEWHWILRYELYICLLIYVSACLLSEIVPGAKELKTVGSFHDGRYRRI